MLDDFGVLDPENVDDGVAVLSQKACVAAVKQHIVSVCENAFDLTACAGIIFGNPFDVVAKSVETVRGERRMLRVRLTAVEANRSIDISLEQRLVVKTNDGLFVLFQFNFFRLARDFPGGAYAK